MAKKQKKSFGPGDKGVVRVFIDGYRLCDDVRIRSIRLRYRGKKRVWNYLSDYGHTDKTRFDVFDYLFKHYEFRKISDHPDGYMECYIPLEDVKVLLKKFDRYRTYK